MTEIFWFLFGMIFGVAAVGFVFREIGDEEKEKTEQPEMFSAAEEEGIDPMTLRNGYGVTRDRNPTFAEQWVNIMNYSGESQTEDGYEEENDNAEGYLG